MFVRSSIYCAALLGLLLLPLRADAATIYGANGTSTLWLIDDSTGASSAVGTGGFNLTELAFHPDGTLWGIGSPTGGGAERLITIDTTDGSTTQVTASVTSLGQGGSTQGIRDMTFGTDGQLYLNHHRYAFTGSGVGTFEASTVDGSSGDFIFATGGGGPIGTLASGDLLSLSYSTPLSVVAALNGTVTPLTDFTGDGLCSAPTSTTIGGSPYKILAVDPASGVIPMAFVTDGDRLCRINVNAATISSVGLFSNDSGPTFLTGIAVAPVPEPSAMALVLIAGAALARRAR